MRSEPLEWSRVSVQELISRGALQIGDGYRAKNAELGGVGLPFARAGNVRGGFEFEDADILCNKSVAKAGSKIAQPGDVVFTSKGTVGRVAFVTEATDRFVYSPQLCFWRVEDREVLDPRYLYFWMQGPECRAQLQSLKGQTDMADYISLRDQRSIGLRLPLPEEQQRITSILGALDDKIDSNRRLVRYLDEFATSRFRHQFGEVWTHESDGIAFDELCEVVSGGTPRTSEKGYWGGEVPWISIKDLKPGPYVLETERTVTSQALQETRLRAYPANTVVISARGTVGLVALTACEMAFNQSCFGLLGRNGVGQMCVLQLARLAVTSLKARAHGSVFSTITRSTFTSLKADLPGHDVLEAFEREATPLYDAIRGLMTEAGTLGRIRDRLLPKLVSGEIRVTSADPEVIEPLVEEHAA